MKHSELIAELGGVAGLLGKLPRGSRQQPPVTVKAIEKWRERNNIPLHWRRPIAAIADAEGVSVPDGFLELPVHPAVAAE
jgi:hypothetical protein